MIFSFIIILQTVGLLGRMISSSQGLYLNKGQHKHRIKRYEYRTSMPCVVFEPMIPASQRTKTTHALDRPATVTISTHQNAGHHDSIRIANKSFKEWRSSNFTKIKQLIKITFTKTIKCGACLLPFSALSCGLV
jgi:hypothetical protein